MTLRNCAERREQHFMERPNWIDHVCNVKGCRERYATIDGNEKVHRIMCASDKSSVYIDAAKFSIMTCCPNTPVVGGKHQQPSKFCDMHSQMCTPGGSRPTLNLSDDIQNISLTKVASIHMAESLPVQL